MIQTQAEQKQSLHKFDLIFRILGVLLAVATVIIIWLVWVLYRPITPLVIKSTHITSPVVSSTGTLRYDLAYCKYTDKSPIVYRQIVPLNTGESLVTFPSVLGITTPGCHAAHLTLPMIPDTTPGHYRVKGHLVYQVNSFRSVSIDYLTDEFTLTK